MVETCFEHLQVVHHMLANTCEVFQYCDKTPDRNIFIRVNAAWFVWWSHGSA